MEKLIINGGYTLRGTVKINGAKNAVLPIIAATLLSKEKCQIQNAPNLTDVHTICAVLRHLGAEVHYVEKENTIYTETKKIVTSIAPYEYVRSMRASFLVMGPLLARTGQARISLPGGCAIGTRPIDLHLKGFKALGAKINYCQGYIEATADKLQGNQVYLDFPSVGATENILMAATLAEGKSTIENAAEEPEIVDLANFLNYMGAKIKGAGTRVIRIEGVEGLCGAEYGVIPDRIEAATYMVAAAITGGEVEIQSILVDHLKPVMAKLQETGVTLTETTNGLKVKAQKMLNGADIKTMPYPGFPTDMQPQMMALLSVAKGTSVVNESVFENRFMHVNELKRMGARIKTEGHVAVIEGVKELSGASVKATDLRAAAALIIAGLVAKGETVISNLQHLDRGYANIEKNLRQLGAHIQRVKK